MMFVLSVFFCKVLKYKNKIVMASIDVYCCCCLNILIKVEK